MWCASYRYSIYPGYILVHSLADQYSVGARVARAIDEGQRVCVRMFNILNIAKQNLNIAKQNLKCRYHHHHRVEILGSQDYMYLKSLLSACARGSATDVLMRLHRERHQQKDKEIDEGIERDTHAHTQKDMNE